MQRKKLRSMLRSMTVGVAMVLAATVAIPAAASAGPDGASTMGVCDYHYEYDVSFVQRHELMQLLPTIPLYNSGGTNSSLEGNVTAGGSYTLGVTGTFGADINAIVAGVNASVAVSASSTVSGTLGMSATVYDVGPGMYGRIYGGVAVVVTTGTYKHINPSCEVISSVSITVKAPYGPLFVTCGENAQIACAVGGVGATHSIATPRRLDNGHDLCPCYDAKVGSTRAQTPPRRKSDFDGDGKADVIWVHKDTGDPYLLRGNGQGGWLGQTAPGQLGAGWNVMSHVFSPGDFDGDGKADVIWVHKDTGDPYLLRGNGQGGWLGQTAPGQLGAGWNVMSHVF